MKVADIRPDALMAGQQAAMLRDIATLLDRRAEFVAVPCPACGRDAPTVLYEKYGMTHNRCAACRTQYISPRPSSAVLRDFYEASENYAYFAAHIFPASAETRRERLFRPRARTVADLARASRIERPSLVEVGAGYGLFCEEVAATGAFGRIVGIEPTPDLAGICRAKGMKGIEAPVEESEMAEPFDILAAVEVVEHLFDPAAFLECCRRLVRPGGWVLFTCPNIHGLDTITLGHASGAVDHEHLNYFHPPSMALLLERCGFAEVSVTTPGRLDVDLVRRALAGGIVRRSDLGAFLVHVLEQEGPDTDALLQRFVRAPGLSLNRKSVV